MRKSRTPISNIPAPLADEALRFMYDLKVLSTADLTQEWSGWKLRGKWLVSPDGARLSPERLRGIFFTEQTRLASRKKRLQNSEQNVAQFRAGCASSVRRAKPE